MTPDELRAELAEIRDGIDGKGKAFVYGNEWRGEWPEIPLPRPIAENLPVVEAWLREQAEIQSMHVSWVRPPVGYMVTWYFEGDSGVTGTGDTRDLAGADSAVKAVEALGKEA